MLKNITKEGVIYAPDYKHQRQQILRILQILVRPDKQVHTAVKSYV